MTQEKENQLLIEQDITSVFETGDKSELDHVDDLEAELFLKFGFIY